MADQLEHCTVYDNEAVELGLPNSLATGIEWWFFDEAARVAKTRPPGV
jgi:hypothetical protein